MRTGTDHLPILHNVAQPGPQAGMAPPQHSCEGLNTPSVWSSARSQAAAKVDALFGLLDQPGASPTAAPAATVAVIRDVTDEHLRQQQLLDAALTDPLTGLNNRRGLEQRLAHARTPETVIGGAPDAPSSGAPTWIMVDIDHFKQVNDRHGHDGGDAVLKAVAAVLRKTSRDGDTLARLGGEEFLLLLPVATATVALLVGERLRQAVAALSVAVGSQALRVTASFGIALQASGESWGATLARADTARYAAKHGGRDQVRLAAQPGG